MDELLLPEEIIITRSQGDNIILTNYRIRQFENGGKSVLSIMLDSIDSVSARYMSQPWLVVIAVFVGIAAIGLGLDSQMTFAAVAIVGAGIFLLLFILSRRHVITIAAGTKSIAFQTSGMDSGKVLKFINDIEHARRVFLISLGHETAK